MVLPLVVSLAIASVPPRLPPSAPRFTCIAAPRIARSSPSVRRMAMSIVEAWQVIMALRHQPAALILARQALPTLDREKYAPASGLIKGALVLADARAGVPAIQ